MTKDIDFIAYLLKELFALGAKAINVRVTNHVHCEVVANIQHSNSDKSNLVLIDKFVGTDHGDTAYYAAKTLIEQLTMFSDGKRPGAFNMSNTYIGLHLNPDIFPMPCQVMVGFVPESERSFIFVLSILKLQRLLKENGAAYSSFRQAVDKQHILSQLTKYV